MHHKPTSLFATGGMRKYLCATRDCNPGIEF